MTFDGAMQTLKRLLDEEKYDPNELHQIRGLTPLMRAADRGCNEAIEILLEANGAMQLGGERA